jgi:tetratricopeptide (TPR) repeat protein
MANRTTLLPPPSPEQRRIAAESFDRAMQVMVTGNYDYAIPLLQTCCKIDPPNLTFRKALRQAQKSKYDNNLRGSRMAPLTTAPLKAKLKAAKSGKHFVRVLELGENILSANPWDTGTQMDMAEAADALDIVDVAVWLLDQARQKDAQNMNLNRALARLLEKRGLFTQAIKLWELIRRADPSDQEASSKSKDLAASETIARGQYVESVGGSNAEHETALDHPAPAPAPSKEPARRPSTKSSAEMPAMPPLPPAPAKGAGPVLRPPRPDVGADRADREAEPLRARIAANPTEPSSYLSLATHYRRSGHLDAARDVLQEGLGASGQHYLLTLELLELELEPFRRNLALTEDKMRSEPADDLRKIRARLLKEINTRELELYRLKAENFPTDLTNRLELGLRLLRAGRIDEAIPELQATRKDARHQWRALMYLGHCFKQRHSWKLAQRNFEEALPLVPPSEEAYHKEILFQLATGHADAGELAQAVEIGLDLANLDFGFRDIGKLLDDWQHRMQKA